MTATSVAEIVSRSAIVSSVRWTRTVGDLNTRRRVRCTARSRVLSESTTCWTTRPYFASTAGDGFGGSPGRATSGNRPGWGGGGAGAGFCAAGGAAAGAGGGRGGAACAGAAYAIIRRSAGGRGVGTAGSAAAARPEPRRAAATETQSKGRDIDHLWAAGRDSRLADRPGVIVRQDSGSLPIVPAGAGQ